MPEASQALKRSAPPALQPRGCEERDEVAEKYAALLAQYDQVRQLCGASLRAACCECEGSQQVWCGVQVLRAHAELEGRYQQLLLQGNDPVQRKAELKGRAGVLAEERETGRADGRKSGVEDVMGALEREVERLEGARAQLEATREGAQRREEARAAEVAYWRREATAAEVARAAKGGELEALKQMLVDEMRGPRGGAERREPAAAPRALPPPPAEEHQVPRPPRAAGIGVVLERVDGETDVFVKSIAPGGAAERDGRVQVSGAEACAERAGGRGFLTWQTEPLTSQPEPLTWGAEHAWTKRAGLTQGLAVSGWGRGPRCRRGVGARAPARGAVLALREPVPRTTDMHLALPLAGRAAPGPRPRGNPPCLPRSGDARP
eukprot:1470344-Rhodomonas_salina.1